MYINIIKILHRLKKLLYRQKLEDSVHLRAVKYGYKKPSGFSYKEINKHYSKRPKDWTVVKEFLSVAHKNYHSGLNHTSPFMHLKCEGNKNIDLCRYVLSYEAYFNYFEYLELVEARRNARNATIMAFISILIAVSAMFLSQGK